MNEDKKAIKKINQIIENGYKENIPASVIAEYLAFPKSKRKAIDEDLRGIKTGTKIKGLGE